MGTRPTMRDRVRRFAVALWQTRQFWLRSPVVWHNVRATWIQSDPGWLSKQPPLDLTDEEYDEFMAAINPDWK